MLTLLTGLLACNNTPVVSGTVHDILTLIEGAMVQMEGNGNKQTTDAQDDSHLSYKMSRQEIFDLELLSLFTTLRFWLAPEMDDDNVDPVQFGCTQNQPTGFYAVGDSEYQILKSGELVDVKSAFQTVYGLARVNDVKLRTSNLSLYITQVFEKKIKQVNLGVYKLAFKEGSDDWFDW